MDLFDTAVKSIKYEKNHYLTNFYKRLRQKKIYFTYYDFSTHLYFIHKYSIKIKKSKNKFYNLLSDYYYFKIKDDKMATFRILGDICMLKDNKLTEDEILLFNNFDLYSQIKKFPKELYEIYNLPFLKKLPRKYKNLCI